MIDRQEEFAVKGDDIERRRALGSKELGMEAIQTKEGGKNRGKRRIRKS